MDRFDKIEKLVNQIDDWDIQMLLDYAKKKTERGVVVTA